MTPSRKKWIFLAAGTLLSLVALYYASRITRLQLEDVAWVRDQLARAGAWAPLVFVLAGAAIVGAGAPRSAYCVLGGAMFGWWEGLLWSNAGSLLGSLGGFAVARRLGREWVYLHWGKQHERLEELLRRDGFMVILWSRLCPVTHNLLINGLAGASTIRTGSFLLASALGFLPSSAMLVLTGSGFALASMARTGIGLVLFLGVSLLATHYFRRSVKTAGLRALFKTSTDAQPAG